MPRRWLLGGGVVLAAVIAFSIIWFEPQAPLCDTTVDGALPGGRLELAAGAEEQTTASLA